MIASEAANRGVLWKKVFLEISQNSQENTCARVSFLIKLQASGTFLCQALVKVSQSTTDWFKNPDKFQIIILSKNAADVIH